MDYIIKRFDKIDERLGSLDERLESIEERLESIEERLESVEERLESVEEVLTIVAPKVLLKDLVYLVKEPSYQKVMSGVSSTWSYIKDENDDYYAIGSAHCGFYHTGNFISLPKEVCDLGVRDVFLSGDLCHEQRFSNLKNDILLIRLHSPVPNYSHRTSFDTTYKEVPEDGSITCGMSSSGLVQGDMLFYDSIQKIYIFIESSGEAGHSGTLMFAPNQTNQKMNLRPIGVYYGTFYNETRKNFAIRSVVVPLDFPSMERRDILANQTHITLGLLKRNLVHKVTLKLKTESPARFPYYSYTHKGVSYYGVVLGGRSNLLCGSAVMAAHTDRLKIEQRK